MAGRRRTEPAVSMNRRPRNELLTADDVMEKPDTVSDVLPDVVQPGSSLQRATPNSRESGQTTSSSSRFAEAARRIKGKRKRIPIGRIPGENLGWVEDGYIELDPSHSRRGKKPIWSLGRPLPHLVPSWYDKQAGPSLGALPEDLAERGANLHNLTLPSVEQQESTAESENARARRTAAGVAHSDKRNDVGQPVFDYQPGEDNSTRRERTNDTHDTTRSNKDDGPNYAIDSEPLGQPEHDDESDGDPSKNPNWWARIRGKHPEPLAEFLATGIAVFMGLGATLSVNLSANQDVKYGTYETSCWAWGFAWMFGIYLGGGVSGAHMNPAISISLSLFRKFPWGTCLVYVLVQFVASIAAAALAYGIYRDSIRYVDPTMTNTAKTFFSTPKEWVSMGTAFFAQVVGSAIMMIAVFALGDDRNNPPGAGMHALVLGLLVTTLKFTLGYNIGSALNPASDFGPRVVAWAVGYRTPEVFQTGWWFYGPWLATLVGSILGCTLYDGLIFVGTESPINHQVKGGIRKRMRRLFDFTSKK
ncbi:aquaporin-like protein [Hypoxylon trugodes]|uniref:aquaporin-like protein n=1 Tax=Hypoxylon trugodes TaxID=326681 RepID=UPI00218E71A9|nr:aquaporin-like protein [Hypoxylon trugodes]KAI1392781.1 aquaporin-like protein [Hypoxylon trugodes]